MNGAESLVRTLIAGGVEVCFSNPGTSEIHFVAALDKVNGIRCVLGLFEGVVTGAADGYARMSDKPAVTLLHLGPGLGNGLANLHNAKKANTPLINIVGEHALWHLEHNAPLTADIEGIARPVSHWVRTAKSSQQLAGDCNDALVAANTHPGHVATLILPANTAWDSTTWDETTWDETTWSGAAGNEPESEETEVPVAVNLTASVPEVAQESVVAAASILREKKLTAIILGHHCLREEPLQLAGKIAQSTGAVLLAETSNARFERGASRVTVESIPYPVDEALNVLKSFENIITVCAKAPVAFFAYPDKPSALWPDNCNLFSLASISEDGKKALDALAQELGCSGLSLTLPKVALPEPPPAGPLTALAVNAIVALAMPEHAIVVDEAITSGRNAQALTQGSNPHSWLQLMGGSIGDGFPLATGAAVACPNQKVIDLQADGSGMYTLQALWTQAREALNVTTVVYSNRRYAILQAELVNVQAISGPIADDMMRLDRPDLDWVKLAEGMGVEALRATTVTQFKDAFQASLSRSTPFLIEAVI